MAPETSMIFVLPGMGADHGMYGAPSWQSLANTHFLDWPDYRGEVSIASVADRVVEQAAIPDGAIVIGSSLGGIVACEIARKRDLKALVLIGSAVEKSRANWLECFPEATPRSFVLLAWQSSIGQDWMRLESHLFGFMENKIA